MRSIVLNLKSLHPRCWYRRAVSLVTGAVLTANLVAAGAAHAASTSNASSPLGINLTSVSYYDAEMPFLDNFKTGSGWLTQSTAAWDTGEEANLSVDANGWPTSLTAVNGAGAQQFTQVSMLLLRSMPTTSNGYYPAGQYVVLYQGQGTLTYGLDASLVTHAAGRDVINVKPSTNGILVTITATDPGKTGNYIKNIQVVQAAQETALTGGQVFNPRFVSLLQNFRVLRYMGWLQTNGSPITSWSQRPTVTSAIYGGTTGVPIEIAVQLSNATSTDGWFNVPHMADNNYITQMATLVHQQLGSNQKAYVEFSNETWNYGFTQAAWIQAQGQAEWPSAGLSTFDANRNWFGQRTAQMCDLWKAAWGADSGRVICVMGAQAANTYTADKSLTCPAWTAGAPCSAHGIGAIAIAPYFGGNVPTAWTTQSDGGLASLFASLTSQNDPSIPAGGWIAQAIGWVKAYTADAANYKLPVVAYEGGQTFEGFPNGVNADGSNTPLTNLYIAANLDPRMATAYTSYLQQWKAAGAQVFMIFGDIEMNNQYGEWGALQSVMQTTSPLSAAPPKWQALQNFISGNTCWWSGCAASVAGVPMAPSGLKVVQ
jgi:hypothetical protein